MIAIYRLSILIAALALLACEDQGVDGGVNFAGDVSGTYFLDYDDSEAAEIVSLTPLSSSSGSWFGIISIQFNGGSFDPFSDQQGVWERTGRQEIKVRVLDYIFDLPDREVTGVALVEYVVRFVDEDFQGLEGEVSGKVFAAGVNPLDPGDDEPIAEFNAAFKGQRLTVEND